MEIAAPSVKQLPICTAFHSKPYLLLLHPHNSISFRSPTSLFPRLRFLKPKKHSSTLRFVVASASVSSDSQDRWLLQPVGDGDWRHIGYKVQLPDAFEIASDEVTVGRVADKADFVIPVATVSGTHARILRNGENLLITDLDSTNGTFINEKRLIPGVAAAAASGNLVTFGDTNLAIFRLTKIENVSKPQDSQEATIEDTQTV